MHAAKGFYRQRLIGSGHSQTGGCMHNYINAIHPLETARNGGQPLYDAYIVAVAGGAFAGIYPINQCRAVPQRWPTCDASSTRWAWRSCTS